MDNLFYNNNCPAKMSDGRIFSDHQSSFVREKHMSNILETQNNHEYRKKLQENGLKIMESNINYNMSKLCQCYDRTCNNSTCKS